MYVYIFVYVYISRVFPHTRKKTLFFRHKVISLAACAIEHILI